LVLDARVVVQVINLTPEELLGEVPKRARESEKETENVHLQQGNAL